MPDKITICQRCRKRLVRLKNGEWYHRHNASVFCRPGDGSHKKAIALEIKAVSHA